MLHTRELKEVLCKWSLALSNSLQPFYPPPARQAVLQRLTAVDFRRVRFASCIQHLVVVALPCKCTGHTRLHFRGDYLVPVTSTHRTEHN